MATLSTTMSASMSTTLSISTQQVSMVDEVFKWLRLKRDTDLTYSPTGVGAWDLRVSKIKSLFMYYSYALLPGEEGALQSGVLANDSWHQPPHILLPVQRSAIRWCYQRDWWGHHWCAESICWKLNLPWKSIASYEYLLIPLNAKRCDFCKYTKIIMFHLYNIDTTWHSALQHFSIHLISPESRSEHSFEENYIEIYYHYLDSVH